MQPTLSTIGTNSEAGTWVRTHEMRQSPADADVAFAPHVSNNFFFEQSPILILPSEMISRIFMPHKNLCSLTLTCTTLYKMRNLSDIRIPIRDFKVMNLFHTPRGISDMTIVELIQAVHKRPLNLSEAAGVPCSSDYENEFRAQHFERKLLSRFNNRCVQLSIKPNSCEFIFCANIVVKKLKKTAAYLNIPGEDMRDKLETTAANFLDGVCNEVISAYADQPIEVITPDYFKAKIIELKSLFPRRDVARIEAHFRNAIRNRGNSTA